MSRDILISKLSFLGIIFIKFDGNFPRRTPQSVYADWPLAITYDILYFEQWIKIMLNYYSHLTSNKANERKLNYN